MVDLASHRLTERLEAEGLTVTTRPPARIWLAAGPGVAPNTAEGSDPVHLWLAPNRRLIVADSAVPTPDVAFLSDITDGLHRFAISGPHTNALLAMATSLDPAVLPPGRCAQTLWAGVKVTLHRTPDALLLYVDRPLAPWLLDWFRVALTAFAKG